MADTKPETTTVTPKEQQPQKNPKFRVHKKKKQPQQPNDPTKIVESILAQSNFKTANLSNQIDELYYNSPEYSNKVRRALRNIKYECSLNSHFTYDDLTVLPEGFNGHVAVGPIAIMNMACINKKPEKRRRKWQKQRRRMANSEKPDKVDKDKDKPQDKERKPRGKGQDS